MQDTASPPAEAAVETRAEKKAYSLSDWVACEHPDMDPETCARYRRKAMRRRLIPLDHSLNTTVQQPQRKVQTVGSRGQKNVCCKPTGKVGNKLAALLKQLGIDSKWCSTGCNGYSKQMNAWGCDGCRQRRAEIVQRLEQQQRSAGWSVTAKAAGMALVSGIAFEIDLTDPLGWLVDEAIRRAEAKLQAECPCEAATAEK